MADTWTGDLTGVDVAAHKARHQDAGLDEVNIAGLLGEPDSLTTHKSLTTGVHGAGTDTLATNGQAIIWAIVFGG